MSITKNLQTHLAAMPKWASEMSVRPGLINPEDDSLIYEGQRHQVVITDTDARPVRELRLVVRLQQWVFADGEVTDVGVVLSPDLPDVLSIEDARKVAMALLSAVVEAESSTNAG